MRGIGFTLFSFGGENVIRLAGNLVLTRILFPEAFGLMALVNVFLAGVRMFSDLGINASIIQSNRGDDPLFLNTAWCVQILRGVILWLLFCAIAFPVSWLYDEPRLAYIMPVVGLQALISGFSTTKVATANRHLHLGLQTGLMLLAQLIALIFLIFLAWQLQSVWALVIGGLVSVSLKVIFFHVFLPGHTNRLQWDWTCFYELFSFGKFVFLTTMSRFFIDRGDKAVMAGFISFALLGVYNMGYMLAVLPLTLVRKVSMRVIFPLYRMKSPTESVENQQKLFRARRGIILGSLCLNALFALSGVALIEFLYDPRYALAGPVIVLFCCSMVPVIAFEGYVSALLGHGDSKRGFYYLILTAIIQLGLLFLGVNLYGIFGAIIAPGIAALLTYPLLARFVRRYSAWDGKGDIAALVFGTLTCGGALWLHWEDVLKLMTTG